jgi:hypothetical protein
MLSKLAGELCAWLKFVFILIHILDLQDALFSEFVLFYIFFILAIYCILFDIFLFSGLFIKITAVQ